MTTETDQATPAQPGGSAAPTDDTGERLAQIRALLLEPLADAEHASWAGWMAYLFSKCAVHADGSATIPVWAAERWARQVETPYADLSEPEKDNDRGEVERILPLIAGCVDSLVESLTQERDEARELADAWSAQAKRTEHERDEARREAQRFMDANQEKRHLLRAAIQERDAMRAALTGIAEEDVWEGSAVELRDRARVALESGAARGGSDGE